MHRAITLIVNTYACWYNEVRPTIAPPLIASGMPCLKQMKLLKNKNLHSKSIASISLFEGLEDAQLQNLAERFIPTEVEKGEVLLEVDQSVDGFWILLEGTAFIMVQGEIVAERSVGDFLGEMGALLGQKASATVVAGTKIIALKMQAAQFREIAPRETLLKLLQTTGDRRRDLGLRLAESLQHTSQGLVRVDPQGKITSDISSQCQSYFGATSVYDLRFKNFSLVLDELCPGFLEGWESFELLFNRDFDEEQRQMVMSVLPEQVVIPGDMGPRVLKLDYYSCLDAQGILCGVDIGMTDISNELALEQFESQQQTRAKLLAEPECYMSLLSLAERIQDSLGLDAPRMLRADIHTLKGLAGIFDLEPLSRICHSLEEQLVVGNFERDTLSDFEDQVSYVGSFFDQLSQPLKDRLLGVVFPKKDFARLKTALQQAEIDHARMIVEQASSRPASVFARPYGREVRRIAAELGKQAELVCDCEGVYIPSYLDEPLTPLLHIVRNAVYHGLESVEDRRKAGKPETGTLKFTAVNQGKWLVLTFEDDGRGLDVAKISSKARKLGLLETRRVPKAAQLSELIFHPELSTRNNVDLISGRGVGLSAIKESVEGFGGTIVVTNSPGKGLTVDVKVPISR